MVSIARKNLFRDKTRLAISVGGVAAAIMLILIVVGLFLEVQASPARYVLNTQADLWVVSEDAEYLFDPSLLPETIEENLRGIEGVRDVNGLILSSVTVHLDGEKDSAILFAYDNEDGVGGPWRVQGTQRARENEIIIDRVFARINGLKLKDTVKIKNREFTVAGISDETAIAMFNQYVFISLDDAKGLIGTPGFVDMFLVSVDGSSSVGEVASRIKENISGVSVHTKADFANATQANVAKEFVPIVGAIAAIGLFVGATVVGLTIYTATVEKTREYGVLKALGASNRRLYGVVIEQALVASIFGFAFGVGFAQVVAYVLDLFIPGFTVLITIPLLGEVLLLVALTSIVASFLPSKRIAGIDPAMVFRA